MITLREITRDTFYQCAMLKVAEDQKMFVAPNTYSMAQAKYCPECVPLAIYADDEMVGFLMHAIDLDDDNLWIYRLMIDAKHQGKGYATKAMNLILNQLKQDKTRNKILLSYEPENKGAEALYLKLGFKHTGRVIDGEAVMQLDY